MSATCTPSSWPAAAGPGCTPSAGPNAPSLSCPCLGAETLLQLTVARLLSGEELALRPDDVTVVTDRRYGRHVRGPAPRDRGAVRAARPEHGRGHRPRDARHRPARRRGDGRPARRPRDRSGRRMSSGRCSATPPITLRRARSTSRSRSSRSASRPTGRRPNTATSSPTSSGARGSPGSTPTRCAASRRSRRLERASQIQALPGVAWNAGMFLWRRRAIRAALERYTGLLQSLEPVDRTPNLLEKAYDRIKPISIDHAVMEAAPATAGRHGVDGRRLDRPRQLDARCSARSASAGTGDRGPGRRDGRDRHPGTWSFVAATAGLASSRSTRAVA